MDQLNQIEHLTEEQKEEILIHRDILIGAIENDNSAINEGLTKLLKHVNKSLDKYTK